MDRIINSAEGYPLSREWLNFFENQSLEAINALAKTVGDNVIISGMINTDGNVSAGVLIYNNEILPFEAGTFASTVVIVETVVSEGYDTAENDSFSTILPVWATRVAKFGNPGDADVVDSFAFNVLNRIDNLQAINGNRIKLLKEGDVRITFDENNVAENVMVTGDFTSGTQSGNFGDNRAFANVFFDELPNTNYFLVFEPDSPTTQLAPYNHYYCFAKATDNVRVLVYLSVPGTILKFKLKLYGI